MSTIIMMLCLHIETGIADEVERYNMEGCGFVDIDFNSIESLIKRLDDVSSVDCTNAVLNLVVDASDALKKFARFYAYWSGLCTDGNINVE